MTAPSLLGIDGGGTSTVAWLADSEGNVLGRGQSGPSNAKAVGISDALAALEQAVVAAFNAAGLTSRRVDVACLGLAGFAMQDEQRLLREWAERVRLSSRLVTVTDGALVVAAGTSEGWGVGVIAGTGSIAVGRDRLGRTARAGGWGHLFGDEGSAYAVVLSALRRVARRADRRDPAPAGHDPLTARLCEALGVSEPQSLVSALYAPSIDRTTIAGLAPVVLAAAQEDSTVGSELLEPAGRELALAATAAARALGWSEGSLPLALAGGFLLASNEVSQSLINHLERSGYAPIAKRVTEPVRGALVLAQQALQETEART